MVPHKGEPRCKDSPYVGDPYIGIFNIHVNIDSTRDLPSGVGDLAYYFANIYSSTEYAFPTYTTPPACTPLQDVPLHNVFDLQNMVLKSVYYFRIYYTRPHIVVHFGIMLNEAVYYMCPSLQFQKMIVSRSPRHARI